MAFGAISGFGPTKYQARPRANPGQGFGLTLALNITNLAPVARYSQITQDLPTPTVPVTDPRPARPRDEGIVVMDAGGSRRAIADTSSKTSCPPVCPRAMINDLSPAARDKQRLQSCGVGCACIWILETGLSRPISASVIPISTLAHSPTRDLLDGGAHRPALAAPRTGDALTLRAIEILLPIRKLCHPPIACGYRKCSVKREERLDERDNEASNLSHFGGYSGSSFSDGKSATSVKGTAGSEGTAPLTFYERH
ncbi:hypothetical protein B0H10DRAFT_2428914, partial [Mycena sp. CBHHK59/15]